MLNTNNVVVVLLLEVDMFFLPVFPVERNEDVDIVVEVFDEEIVEVAIADEMDAVVLIDVGLVLLMLDDIEIVRVEVIVAV